MYKKLFGDKKKLTQKKLKKILVMDLYMNMYRTAHLYPDPYCRISELYPIGWPRWLRLVASGWVLSKVLGLNLHYNVIKTRLPQDLLGRAISVMQGVGSPILQLCIWMSNNWAVIVSTDELLIKINIFLSYINLQLNHCYAHF